MVTYFNTTIYAVVCSIKYLITTFESQFENSRGILETSCIQLP